MKIEEKHFWYGMLFLIIIISFGINARVAVSTPLIFGDEGYYGSRGMWILENLEIPKYHNFYSHDNLFGLFWLDVPMIIFLVSSFFAIG